MPRLGFSKNARQQCLEHCCRHANYICTDYHKVMEILEAHNCNWVTDDEEYNTSTANRRLYINVKLSIAQNEADIDGERIDVVFDSKIAHGTVVSATARSDIESMQKSVWKSIRNRPTLYRTLSAITKAPSASVKP